MYNPIYRSHFNKDIKSLKKDRKSIILIKNAIEQVLIESPYENSQSLAGPLNGKRKYKKSDIRIIFAICEECRSLNHLKLNGCNDCSDYDDKTLMFFKAGRRKNIYK